MNIGLSVLHWNGFDWTRLLRPVALTWLLLSGLPVLAAPEDVTAIKRPNVVLLLIDDVGLTDLGAYGGDARTPHIDQLAANGAMFTSYRTSPLCSPSRAMLLTGIDSHRTGLGTLPETLPRSQRGKPGYSMGLEPGIETVATRLKAEGYRSYMTGKWHLGHGPGQLPVAHGFDRSFILDASGADNWEQKTYMPYYQQADWFEDGKRAQLPKDFYSSQFLVDQMMAYLDKDQARSEPFFAYIGFQAIHIPVQAPEEYTERYLGQFDQGWDVLRTVRWQRAQERGLIPQGAPLAATHEKLRPWASLDKDEQALYAKSMAVQAGMIEAMDHHIGRLVEYLKAKGEFDNTIFIVTSDNGPEPSDPTSFTGYEFWMKLYGHNRRIDNLGERSSISFIGPEWASATASPSKLFKFQASDGGLRVPLIASGPGIPAGRRVTSNSFVTDVTPTIYDYVGIAPERWNGPVPMNGKSLKGVLSGVAETTHDQNSAVGIEVGGSAALFKAEFKLVKDNRPWGDDQWRLYDIKTDPGETQDLSRAQPDRFKTMIADYEAYARDVGVLPLPDDFDMRAQIQLNARLIQLSHYRYLIVGTVALLIALVWLARRRARRNGPG